MSKIVFLDRDGVINKYPGNFKYVTSWKGFRFLPRVKKALRRLNEMGYKIFVISNQAGVSKGIYSKKTLDTITRNMLTEIKKSGADIEGVYYCIHRNEDNCSCRKPKAGLIKKALKEHGISKPLLKKTFVVGDSYRDVQTGKSAGCRTILVFSGREKPANQPTWPLRPDFTAKDLSQAVDIILSRKPRTK